MTAAARGLRLVPVALAAWGTAAFAVLVPSAAGVAAACLAASFVLALGVLRIRRAVRWAVTAVALAVAAAVCGTVALSVEVRGGVADAVGASGRPVEMRVTVVGRLDRAPAGDVWFDAAAASVRSRGHSVAGPAPVRIGVPPEHAVALERVDLGAVLRIRGVGLEPEPGAREAAVLRATGDVELLTAPEGVWGVLGALRSGFAASAARLPGPGAGLVPGLAVGDTSAVAGALDDAMKAASLTHLTAVSGTNCAVVVGIAFAGAALLRARRGVRISAGFGALTLFVLLVTPEPSVVRAAAMATIAMVALALGRSGAGLAVLSAAVAVLLLADPWLALEWGFALSVVATASLLVLARPIAAALARRMPPLLAVAIAVPLAAQLACAPLLVMLDPHVPLLGVVANLLAAPAAPMATVVGLFACLAAPIPVLQEGLVAVAWLPASWIAGVAHTIAGLPAQRLPWLSGLSGAILLALLCAAVAISLLVGRGGTAGRLMRAASVAAVAAAGGAVVGQAALVTVVAPWSTPSSWQVVLCDVGQGDAVLLRSGAATALVDTGPDPEPLRACLQRFGVDAVDLLVLTHFDADHVGGVAAVVGRVGAVWHGPPDSDGARILATLEAAGARPRSVVAGDTGSLGAAVVHVHWPARSVTQPGNDASVAIDVVGGGLPSTLLLGDLGEESQRRLRGAVRLGEYDVVKVAHHGSADQDADLYRRTDPELALVPVGKDNDYGHPRATLLTLLESTGARISRSDLDGAIAVWAEDGGLRLWREHGVVPCG